MNLRERELEGEKKNRKNVNRLHMHMIHKK